MRMSLVLEIVRPCRREELAVLAALAAACASPTVHATDFTTSGFATLAIGQTSGPCVVGAMAPEFNGRCTRYIADWAHAGVYEDRLDAKPETRAGVQGTWRIAPEFSATTQLTARALRDQHVNVEWLYGTWQPTSAWTVQVGRKRLPLYYYSDFQDIGYAYNTVRPSPDVYGWDVVNYNGVNVSHTSDLGGWTVRTDLLAGSERSRKNAYSRLLTAQAKDIRWQGITGLVVEASQGDLSARLSYVRSGFKQTDRASGATEVDSGNARQTFLGLALSADVGHWVLRSEIGESRRNFLGYQATFGLLTAGYRHGDFTWTAGYSSYRETPTQATYVALHSSGVLGAVRYELHKGGALKLQWDRARDRTSAPFAGNARLLSASYDLTF